MSEEKVKETNPSTLEDLFTGLRESIEAANAGLLLPTADELNEPVPKVRIVGKPMFGRAK